MTRSGLIPLAIGIAVMAAIGLSQVNADTSGPNGSGYVWVDTNSPSPTTDFNYIDITATGTDLEFSDDDSELVSLPFDFTYFGTTYTDVIIASNGFLSFDTVDAEGCNDNYNSSDDQASDSPNGSEAGYPIPHGAAPSDCDDIEWAADPLIAVWFTDQDNTECGEDDGTTQYETQGDMFIVQWYNCNNESPNGDLDCTVDFEVILFEGSNDIKFQYNDTTYSCDDEIHDEDNGAYATVGLSESGDNGLQYEWNEPVLEPGLAVLWTTGAVEEPTEEACEELIPGIPCGILEEGSSGGGGGGGSQTGGTPGVPSTPVPVAPTATLPAPAPTQPGGGQQGVITAPDTGTGPSGSGSANRLGLAAVLLTMGALAVTGGSLAFARRR